MTYRGALTALSHRCAPNNCSEMGIRAENYPQRGLFYVATAERTPFCRKRFISRFLFHIFFQLIYNFTPRFTNN